MITYDSSSNNMDMNLPVHLESLDLAMKDIISKASGKLIVCLLMGLASAVGCLQAQIAPEDPVGAVAGLLKKTCQPVGGLDNLDQFVGDLNGVAIGSREWAAKEWISTG